MRFGAVIPCANDFRFLPAVVGQVRRVAERVLVVRNRRAFSGSLVDLLPMPAVTAMILWDTCIDFAIGDWPTEHATRNAGLDLLSDCDYVFTLDADEIMFDADLDYVANVCETGRGRHRAIAARFHTYWKTPEWRIDPPEFLAAPVAVRRDERFVHLRRVEDGVMQLAKPWVHHLSYVRTDEEMREKLARFAHASEVRPGWFEDVWARWTPEVENLHPVRPEHYRRAVRAPDEGLLGVLRKHGVC